MTGLSLLVVVLLRVVLVYFDGPIGVMLGVVRFILGLLGRLGTMGMSVATPKSSTVANIF